jgi:heme-degrading monooxygenase HmoA
MTTSAFANLPDPPYYSVIFSSQRTPAENGYDQMADRMVELASRQPGYLGVESVRGADGFGITVSYWTSLESIANWRSHAEHRIAQETGKALWYEHYELRIACVERAYARRTELINRHGPGACLSFVDTLT